MISSTTCTNCEGLGCSDCNYVGWFIFNDADNLKYYAKIENNKVAVGGLAPEINFWTKIWRNYFSEPHDFLWAIEKIQKKKRVK